MKRKVHFFPIHLPNWALACVYTTPLADDNVKELTLKGPLSLVTGPLYNLHGWRLVLKDTRSHYFLLEPTCPQVCYIKPISHFWNHISGLKHCF